MRDFIQTLLDFLKAVPTALVGTEFKDQIQDEPARATAIFESTPTPTPAIARAQVRNFQLQTRAANYDTALGDAWNMHDKLDASDGEGIIEINGTPYKFMITTPRKLKTDTQQRTYFFFNFSVSVPK